VGVGIGSVGPSEVQRYGFGGSGISHLSPFHSVVLSYFKYGCWDIGLGFWIEFRSADIAPSTNLNTIFDVCWCSRFSMYVGAHE